MGAAGAVVDFRQAQRQFVDGVGSLLQDLGDVLGGLVRERRVVDGAGQAAGKDPAVTQREVEVVQRLLQPVQLVPVAPVGGGERGHFAGGPQGVAHRVDKRLAVPAPDQGMPGLGGVAVAQRRGAFPQHFSELVQELLDVLARLTPGIPGNQDSHQQREHAAHHGVEAAGERPAGRCGQQHHEQLTAGPAVW